MTHFKPWCAAAAALALAGLALPASADVPPAERQVLLDLYDNTNGNSWATKTNWKVNDPCTNNWYGISCNAGNTRVTSISLDGNMLSGELPDLSNLRELKNFWAGNNSLAGQIPRLPDALEYFMVWGNDLSGPIPKAPPNKQYFDLGGNQFTGGFPELPVTLEGLYLSRNQLSGPIPDLSSFHQLVNFYVNDNQWSGPIPNLPPNVSNVGLENNQLTGSIPGLPASVVRFDVANNKLTGAPPAAPVGLIDGDSLLCPNFLSTPAPTPADDAAWDAAVGATWSVGCATPDAMVTVTPDAGPGGSVWPAAAQSIVSGAITSLRITPATGYAIDSASGCNGTLTGGSYTTDPVTANCTVTVAFKALTIASVTPVPTLGEWALLLLGTLLAGLGVRRLGGVRA